MTYDDKQDISLGPLDAAIVLRENGTIEATIPEVETDYIPENIVTGAAVMYSLQNERMCDLIHEHFMLECAMHDPSPLNDNAYISSRK